MIRAAGILFRTKANTALFLKRAGDGDYPGFWTIPGGKLEEGETPEQAAVRETKEEAGNAPKGKRGLLARTISGQGATPIAMPDAAPDTLVVPEEQVDFTTFLQDVDEPFDVEIDDESSGFAWAPIDSPPEPLHPGCAIAIRRIKSDELGVARMMAAGELTSPQFYKNVALFDIRITGTGTSFRKSCNEYVFRPPEEYLTPDFLARCNGLPVLWEHPAKALLDAKEWKDRVVGTVFLPYVKGSEVWAVVKIYDESAAEIMTEGGISTSPSVDFATVFKTATDNVYTKMEDGSKLLIEGKPSLLDHIAICDKGVWDKGGLPAGVISAKADSDMSDDDKKAKDDAAKADQAKADQARKDAENDMFGKLMSKMDSMSARMDSWEEEKKADKVKADKAKADADEEEKRKSDKAKADNTEEKKANEAANEPGAGDPDEVERKKGASAVPGDKSKADEDDEKKAREDRAKKDAEEEKKRMDARADSERLHAKMADLESRLTARDRMSGEDLAQLSAAQSKADAVYTAFGDRAPAPMTGESLLSYKRRMATHLKQHSKSWSGVDLMSAFADATAFAVAEQQIYADALESARNPKGLPNGELREIVRDNGTHKLIEFAGEPRAWLNDYAPNRMVLRGINNNAGR